MSSVQCVVDGETIARVTEENTLPLSDGEGKGVVDISSASGPSASNNESNVSPQMRLSDSADVVTISPGEQLGRSPDQEGRFIAPALRVEMLRDEEGHSSTCGSDEETVLSHGDASDLDTSTHSQNEDSAATNEFVPPTDELKDRIIKQVDFYFSDANILKDAFLLKHVRRNKQGFVSLKLITSFRKVKSLTKDYRVVAYSLRQSENLEVNEEGTKVRRKKALPDYDETTPSRTIVAVNLPFENPSIENVAELFSKCGDIALVRILRPGKSIPQDVKKHMSKHPEIGNTVCAVVEFEHHESAAKCCDTMTNGDDWRKGLRVVLLSAPKKDKQKEQKTNAEKSPNGAETDSKDPDEKRDQEEKRARHKANKKKRGSRVEMLAQEADSPYCSSGSDVENYDSKERRRSSGAQQQQQHQFTRSSLSPKSDVHHLSPNTTPRNSPRNSPRSSPRSSPNARRKSHGKSPLAASDTMYSSSPKPSPAGSPELRRRSDTGSEIGSSPGHSPWVQRRLKAQAEGMSVSPLASPRMGRRTPDGKMADMGGVVRQPRGPDGTKGFLGRGKARSETA